jgi:hypothetical protein
MGEIPQLPPTYSWRHSHLCFRTKWRIPWSQDVLRTFTVPLSQELLRILWNSKVHYRVHNSPQLVPTLTQTSALHALPSRFFKICPLSFPQTLPKDLSSDPSKGYFYRPFQRSFLRPFQRIFPQTLSKDLSSGPSKGSVKVEAISSVSQHFKFWTSETLIPLSNPQA